MSNIGSDEILTESRHLTDQGRGVCVGRPVNGVTVHVIPISDDPIPTWDASLQLKVNQVGEFVVRGPIVTKRYFHRDEATKLAKMYDQATGETLHRMGDVGYIDDQGRMWFAGRKSHRVETPHGTLFTDMVEPIFNTVRGVARTALVGVRRGGVTHPVLCFEVDEELRQRFRHPRFGERPWPPEVFLEFKLVEVAKKSSLKSRIAMFLHHPRFPVDVRHNSKIFREKLAVWADKQLGSHWTPEEPT